jgi:hypothetical protein
MGDRLEYNVKAGTGVMYDATARAAPYYRIGQLQHALGDKAKAIAAFERALAFKSGLSPKVRSDAEEQLKLLRK